ncbi:uncharacterized protein LOC143565170 [Bidens hawaiensis]|uniref:uncharacterized protein LOC143565170 n=1 Tax=Bidens hawaiensis TaxID=980011 RepID=UPI0040492E30
MDAKIHPAAAISNIKNFIPITLDNETAQYVTWFEQFRIHCTAFQVQDHLAKSASPAATFGDKASAAEIELWNRLDAIVLQWIYGTISTDLLQTIIKPKSTVCAAWEALETLFQDNKPSRALYLQQKLTNTRLEDFLNMEAYCREVKALSDQLTNVDAPLNNQQLVLQLITGLTEQYETTATILQNEKPLPTFNEARSRLCHEEAEKTNKAMQASKAVATHFTPPHPTQTGPPPPRKPKHGQHPWPWTLPWSGQGPVLISLWPRLDFLLTSASC